MDRQRRGRRLSIGVALAAAALACAGGPEEAVLHEFFRASRLRDRTAVSGMAVTAFDPAQRGTVLAFDIIGMAPEGRAPVTRPHVVADLSLHYLPEGPAPETGLELITKEVAIDASVREPAGDIVRRRLVVTMQRAAAGNLRAPGRWIITNVR